MKAIDTWSAASDTRPLELVLAEAEEAHRAALQRRYIPRSWRESILDRPCAYCGGVANRVDHVVPVARGGTSIRENLAPACRSCNDEKLDWLPWEWRAWREAEGLSWPPTSREATIAGLLAR
jgi:5-methylcytosine-specific restriction endonuclease McrA